MKRTVCCCLLCVLLCSLSACQEENRTTDTRSDSFADQAEKLAFFASYAICPTAVKDADYHLIYNDNSSRLLPAPTEWDVSAVIQVDPEDIPVWTKDMVGASAEDIDFTWWAGLGPLADTVAGETPSALYRREDTNSFLVVYQEAGILLKRFWAY